MVLEIKKDGEATLIGLFREEDNQTVLVALVNGPIQARSMAALLGLKTFITYDVRVKVLHIEERRG